MQYIKFLFLQMVSQYNSNRHTRVDRKVLWWSRNRRTPSALARRATEEDAPECGPPYPAAIRRCATNVRVCDCSSFIIN